jgi:RNA polymerase sigma-70 factor (ECF subfamily)
MNVRTADRPKRTARSPNAVTTDDDATDALIAAYGGDRAAWETLFDRFAPRLLGFFQRCLRDPALAEDHVQATFVELHRARCSYTRGTPVRRWIFTIATRVRVGDRSCLDRAGPCAATPATSASVPGDSARDRQVRRAIDGLGNTERSIIHLHRFERMSFAEIAEVLGRPEAAVRRQALQAYHQLREQLWALSDDGERS